MAMDVVKISLFARGHKAFGDGFKFLPTGADLFGLAIGDLVVVRSLGDNVEEVGEFLDNLVGGGNQVMRLRNVLGVLNKKAAGALANPLGNPMIAGALEQCFNAVKRVGNAAATGVFGRLGPFINHRNRQADVLGDLLGRLRLKNLTQQFVGLHDQTMKKPALAGKREGGREYVWSSAFRRKCFGVPRLRGLVRRPGAV